MVTSTFVSSGSSPSSFSKWEYQLFHLSFSVSPSTCPFTLALRLLISSISFQLLQCLEFSCAFCRSFNFSLNISAFTILNASAKFALACFNSVLDLSVLSSTYACYLILAIFQASSTLKSPVIGLFFNSRLLFGTTCSIAA